MKYLVGDIQGCAGALGRLLEAVAFSPSRDHLYVLGDLVNRGPDSLDTLRRLRSLGSSATCLLGNHDWHLLGVAAGVRKLRRGDTLDDILAAPDKEAWLEWLRRRRMAVYEEGWLMVHAGVVPQWTLQMTLDLAAALEQALRDLSPEVLLATMFGSEPSHWSEVKSDTERLRFTLNTLTRTRYITADGRLDFEAKEGLAEVPPGLVPWFEAPHRLTVGVPIAFGHWSSLGLLQRPEVVGLDTGCVWGGKLTALRIDEGRREAIQVECSGDR